MKAGRLSAYSRGHPPDGACPHLFYIYFGPIHLNFYIQIAIISSSVIGGH